MFEMIRVWFWRHSRRHDQWVACALGALVRELGESAVITLDQLNAIDPSRVEITKNDDPEGIRIVLRA